MPSTRSYALVAGLLFGLVATRTALAQQIPVSGDTYVSTNSATLSQNFGSAPSLLIDGNDSALLSFDLSKLPQGVVASQVSQATLSFYVNQLASPGTVSVAALSQAFAEASATGVNAPALQAVSASVSPPGANAFVTVDVTALVQAWITTPASNLGVALTTSDASLMIDSKESAATSHSAVLNITYTGGTSVPGISVDPNYSNFEAGTGNGVPTGAAGAGGSAIGDTNTIVGTGNVPNAGRIRETTIFGSENLRAYTGYCGGDPTSQVETGLNVAVGDLDAVSLPANAANDCRQPSTNTDWVMVGQKVFTGIKSGQRNTAIGNHMMDGSDQISSGCFLGGSFTMEGTHSTCLNSEVLANGGLTGNTLSLQRSMIAGAGIGPGLSSIVASNVIGDSIAAYSPGGMIYQSDVFGAQALNLGTAVANSDVMGFLSAASASSVSNSIVLGSSAAVGYSSIGNSVVAGFGAGGTGSLGYSVLIGPYVGTNFGAGSTGGLAVATAVGYAALGSYFQATPDTGCSMEAFGVFAGGSATSTGGTTACADTFIGYRSGSGLTTASSSVFIGANSGLSSLGTGAESNDTVIGAQAQVTPGVFGAAQIGGGTNAKSNSMQFHGWNFLDTSGNGTFNRLHEALYTPPSSSSSCVAGDFADDATFHYVCVADNTWKRVALSSF